MQFQIKENRNIELFENLRVVDGKIDFIRVDEIKDDQVKVARGILSPVGIRIVSVDELLSSTEVGWERVCIL